MSDDNTIELNRRRVLGGIVTIGGAAAAAGAGTFALFNDTESSSGNSVTAGTLNLELNPSSPSPATSISAGSVVPGDSGYLAINLENTGSVDGTIIGVNIGSVTGGSFSSSLVSDSDGTDPEFNDPDTGSGELDDNLEVEVLLEASGDFDGSLGNTTGSQYTPSGSETTVVSSGTTLSSAVGTNNPGETLNSGSTEVLVINWALPSGTTNEVQGDSVEFDVQAELEQ